MTLEELEKMDCEFLDIPTIASYLGGEHMLQPLRETIRKGVPWAYVVGKAKFVIPRRAFINYHKYGNAVVVKGD